MDIYISFSLNQVSKKLHISTNSVSWSILISEFIFINLMKCHLNREFCYC